MTIATLVKITAQKKLMMKISESSYDNITARLTAECEKKNFRTDRLATFTLENDDGDDCHFMMISLDKYDKQNMRKFEMLLKKEVAIQYRMKPYDFIPESNGHARCSDEQVCGINLELISIRQIRKRVVIDSDSDSEIDEIEHSKAEARREVAECDAIEKKMVTDMLARMASDNEKHGHVTTETLADAEKMISDMPDQATRGLKMLLISIRQIKERNACISSPKVRMPSQAWLRERSEECQKKEDALLQRDMAETEEYYARTYGKEFDSAIDEIADKAAARACSKETELNAEEQAIDEDVEKQVAKHFCLTIPNPPVLERQNGRRRRVCPPEELIAAQLAAASFAADKPKEKVVSALIEAFELATTKPDKKVVSDIIKAFEQAE